MKSKEDPRVRRTRRLLRDALVSLILEKNYTSVSIKEITARADVAYITFFRHFESIDHLLMEVLDDGLSALIRQIEISTAETGTPNPEAEGKFIFEYIEQKSDLFRILFKSQSVTPLRKKVVAGLSAIFQKTCSPLHNSRSCIPVNVASNHIATSLLALIEWWLENKMSPAPPQMGKIYKNLIIDSTLRAVTSS
jgi:AcrR family transcriptional regulator